MEREQLQDESTLVVTVKSSSEFHDDVSGRIEVVERNEAVNSTPTLSFASYDDLVNGLGVKPRGLSVDSRSNCVAQ